ILVAARLGLPDRPLPLAKTTFISSRQADFRPISAFRLPFSGQKGLNRALAAPPDGGGYFSVKG
ncbi:MAG: hypothetical protein ABTR27_06325, partial [Candidatus Competibacter phosphatis]